MCKAARRDIHIDTKTTVVPALYSIHISINIAVFISLKESEGFMLLELRVHVAAGRLCSVHFGFAVTRQNHERC